MSPKSASNKVFHIDDLLIIILEQCQDRRLLRSLASASQANQRLYEFASSLVWKFANEGALNLLPNTADGSAAVHVAGFSPEDRVLRNAGGIQDLKLNAHKETIAENMMAVLIKLDGVRPLHLLLKRLRTIWLHYPTANHLQWIVSHLPTHISSLQIRLTWVKDTPERLQAMTTTYNWMVGCGPCLSVLRLQVDGDTETGSGEELYKVLLASPNIRDLWIDGYVVNTASFHLLARRPHLERWHWNQTSDTLLPPGYMHFQPLTTPFHSVRCLIVVCDSPEAVRLASILWPSLRTLSLFVDVPPLRLSSDDLATTLKRSGLASPSLNTVSLVTTSTSGIVAPRILFTDIMWVKPLQRLRRFKLRCAILGMLLIDDEAMLHVAKVMPSIQQLDLDWSNELSREPVRVSFQERIGGMPSLGGVVSLAARTPTLTTLRLSALAIWSGDLVPHPTSTLQTITVTDSVVHSSRAQASNAWFKLCPNTAIIVPYWEEQLGWKKLRRFMEARIRIASSDNGGSHATPLHPKQYEVRVASTHDSAPPKYRKHGHLRRQSIYGVHRTSGGLLSASTFSMSTFPLRHLPPWKLALVLSCISEGLQKNPAPICNPVYSTKGPSRSTLLFLKALALLLCYGYDKELLRVPAVTMSKTRIQGGASSSEYPGTTSPGDPRAFAAAPNLSSMSTPAMSEPLQRQTKSLRDFMVTNQVAVPPALHPPTGNVIVIARNPSVSESAGTAVDIKWEVKQLSIGSREGEQLMRELNLNPNKCRANDFEQYAIQLFGLLASADHARPRSDNLRGQPIEECVIHPNGTYVLDFALRNCLGKMEQRLESCNRPFMEGAGFWKVLLDWSVRTISSTIPSTTEQRR
ncbi:hypothetical protein CALCODRAFT_513556, partial [Calocera cornea HHB12733]